MLRVAGVPAPKANYPASPRPAPPSKEKKEQWQSSTQRWKREDWKEKKNEWREKGKPGATGAADGKSQKGKGKDGKDRPKGTRNREEAWGQGSEWKGKIPKGKGKTGKKAEPHAPHAHKIFLPVVDPDPAFGFNGRLIGPNGQNVRHIEETTGAKVVLAGRGSGEYHSDEKLHVLLQCQDAASLAEAVRITTDLVDTICDQYETWSGATTRSEPAAKRAKR